MPKKKLPVQLSAKFKKFVHSSLYIVNSEVGFAGQLVMVLLLVGGIGLGTYLVQQRTNLTPKAETLNECQQKCDDEQRVRMVACRDSNVCTEEDYDQCKQKIQDCMGESNTLLNTCYEKCDKAQSTSDSSGDNNGSYVGAGCKGTHSVWGTWNGDEVDVDQDYDEVPGQCGVPDDGSGKSSPGFDSAGNPVSGSGGGVDPITGDPLATEPILPPFAGISLGYGSTIDETDFVSRLRRFKAQIKSQIKAQKFTSPAAKAIAEATDKTVDKYVEELKGCMAKAGFTAPITVATPNAITIIDKLKECETKARELERKLKEDYRLAKFYQIMANFGKAQTAGAVSCVKADLGYKDATLKHINAPPIFPVEPGEQRRLFMCLGDKGDIKWRVNSNTGKYMERLATDSAKQYQHIYAKEITPGEPNVDVVVMTEDEAEKIREGDKNTIQKMFEKTDLMKEVYARFLKVRDLVSKEIGVKLD